IHSSPPAPPTHTTLSLLDALPISTPSADSRAEDKDKPAEPSDELVTTHHTLELPTGPLRYTAQAGRVVLRKEVITDGKSEGLKPVAEIFLTSYTLDDAHPT